MAEKEADLLVDEEDQATDAPELAIAQKKRALGTYAVSYTHLTLPTNSLV